MAELQETYEEIQKDLLNLIQEYKDSDQNDQKTITKIDRKAKKIEQAISSYELDINNTIGPDEEIQVHNQQLANLNKRYQNFVRGVYKQSQSQIVAQVDENQVNQGPQDIQIDITNGQSNIKQNLYNKSPMTSQKISLQPQQQIQDQNNIGMQQNIEMNGQTMVTDINQQANLMKNQNVTSLADLQCAVKGCFQKVDVQCYKCQIWICRGHFYKSAEYKKNVHKYEAQGIDVVTRIRLYCRNCGIKRDKRFKEYRWIIGFCFCSMIIIAIMISFMTYLEVI